MEPKKDWRRGSGNTGMSSAPAPCPSADKAAVCCSRPELAEDLPASTCIRPTRSEGRTAARASSESAESASAAPTPSPRRAPIFCSRACLDNIFIQDGKANRSGSPCRLLLSVLLRHQRSPLAPKEDGPARKRKKMGGLLKRWSILKFAEEVRCNTRHNRMRTPFSCVSVLCALAIWAEVVTGFAGAGAGFLPLTVALPRSVTRTSPASPPLRMSSEVKTMTAQEVSLALPEALPSLPAWAGSSSLCRRTRFD